MPRSTRAAEPEASQVATKPEGQTTQPGAEPQQQATNGEPQHAAQQQQHDPAATAAGAEHSTNPPSKESMGPVASKAQRDMVEKIAKRQGLNREELDARLAEQFSFALDHTPTAMINAVISYVNNLRPAA